MKVVKRFFCFAIGCVALCGIATAAIAGANGGAPLILDTQSGIHDGKGGIVLQNAPLSHASIVAPAQPAPMTELSSGSTAPMVIIPYIAVPNSAVPLKSPAPH
ncbi:MULTISPECIES: hypothetical protein [Burkholderia]|uniref:Lipoprotein n=1 Tax=Burkholderia savannae TaxID=1637837 RepID=A0ABR5T6L9_9BURK|nr:MULTISPECIES: hypothetical protein [Burkholderia]AOJ72182.1 hypothetical protein WS78_25940 [Burkholderia savannae]AOJ83119.1 hypothetical protein WS86_20645 [Burkholderia savannae]AOK50636.1 hypothetical protein WT60_28055 [Burkholderia sp. MSMB617WGS]KGS07521.1 hypothetical protein X946_5919 [Burkholderia sp. ABCPW 111]KVG43320.1 hypothetical protein WS77_12610 [Burkholderia sp. MSMB0265]